MQNKFELFFKLTSDAQFEVARHLPTGIVLNYALVSKQHSTLFAPILNTRKFLHYVARGEHKIVEKMLDKTIELISEKGVVTDCSGRTFENISAFEYTLWAKDKPMWTVMLSCIPQNEKKHKIISILLSQYKNVKEKGVTYVLNGKRCTEHHYDFAIIKELQTQVDLLNQPKVNWDEADKQWNEGVGGAQKDFPMHVVYEYCSNRPFDPLPDFKQQPKLPLSKQFYNYATGAGEKENWFAAGSKLGVEFAIVKGPFVGGGRAAARRVGAAARRVGAVRMATGRDLVAMKALCEVRTNDFINLEQQLESLLEEQMEIDNQPDAPQT